MASLFGLSFFQQDKAALLEQIDDVLSQKKKVGAEPPFIIFTPNPEQIVMAHQEPAFATTLKKANILLPDGIGVVKASRIFAAMGHLRGKSLPALSARIAGVEVVQDLLKKYQAEEMLLVGGKGYHLGKQLKEDFVFLNIQQKKVAWFTGYQSVGFASAEDERKLRAVLRKVKPVIVFVALGAPDQEEWILNHLGLLQQEGVKLAMAVGGSFDVLTGKLKRAPGLWQKLGFEWLFRLIQEPSRWKRQLRLFAFMGMTLKESLKILF